MKLAHKKIRHKTHFVLNLFILPSAIFDLLCFGKTMNLLGIIYVTTHGVLAGGYFETLDFLGQSLYIIPFTFCSHAFSLDEGLHEMRINSDLRGLIFGGVRKEARWNQ